MLDQKNNTTDIIYFTRLHWIRFFWPGLSLFVALIIANSTESLYRVGYFLAIFALIWIGITWLTYFFSSFTIKKNHVIICTGVLVRQTIDIPVNKIEAIDIRQSLLGSILGYGMLCITGTGGTRRIIHGLNSPLTCRRYIEQLIGEAHQKE